MRYLNLNNLDQSSALKAFAKARAEKPWCVQIKGDKFRFRVRARRQPHEINARPRKLHLVTFIIAKAVKLAHCTCEGHQFNAERGRLCYGVAAAWLRFKQNQKRARNRARKLKTAA